MLRGVNVPLVGDFHYIGHKLLADHPACAEALDKYRINPGNVGFREKKDRQFGAIVELAAKHGKSVRIGANWGSLDQELLTHLMDLNARSATPIEARAVTREALVQSAILSATAPRRWARAGPHHPLGQGLGRAGSHRLLPHAGRQTDHALHLGIRGRHGLQGPRRRLRAMGVLLQDGIGDTIRYSLTPEPGGDRTLEVKASQETAADHGLPQLHAAGCGLPGCGRTTSTVFQELAQDIQGWLSSSDARLEVALPRRRGAERRGDGLHRQRPGREQAADIGISLPGTRRDAVGSVFIDGKKAATLKGAGIAAEFKQMVSDYIEQRFGGSGLRA